MDILGGKKILFLFQKLFGLIHIPKEVVSIQYILDLEGFLFFILVFETEFH